MGRRDPPRIPQDLRPADLNAWSLEVSEAYSGSQATGTGNAPDPYLQIHANEARWRGGARLSVDFPQSVFNQDPNPYAFPVPHSSDVIRAERSNSEMSLLTAVRSHSLEPSLCELPGAKACGQAT